MPRFSKASRIRHKDDFDRLREKGHSRSSRCFVIRWVPAEKRRLGIVISKRVAKAYKRNEIKRVARGLFRLHPEYFPMGDVLVIPRMPAGSLQKSKIGSFLTDALKRCF